MLFKLLCVGAAHLAIYPCHDSVVVIGRCKTVRVQERFSFTGGSASADWQAEPVPWPAGSSRYRSALPACPPPLVGKAFDINQKYRVTLGFGQGVNALHHLQIMQARLILFAGIRREEFVAGHKSRP